MNAARSLPAETALRLARASLQATDTVGAEAKCREALALGDDSAAAWTLLGTALRSRDPIAAEAALRRALERNAEFVDARFQLGNLLREQQRFAEAVTEYDLALRLAPGHASLLNNLGLALEGSQAWTRAEAAYRQVLGAQPTHRQALGNLAHFLCRERRYAEALDCCERYLAAYPEADPAIWIDHGICLQHDRHDLERAEASYRRAVALVPGDAASLVNLGSLLVERNDFEAAAEVLARAPDDGPLGLYASTLLALSCQHLCSWDGLAALHGRIKDGIAHPASGGRLANPLSTLSMPLSASAQQSVAREWAERLRPTGDTPFPPPTRAPRAKLRLGYVSSDFRNHIAEKGPMGPMDAYQIVILMSQHTIRHTKQIEEVKAMPGYPAK